MTNRSLLSALLALALFAGPVLAGAHDSDHGLQPGATHACAMCIYAHTGGHGALPTPPALPLGGTVEAPESSCATTTVAVTVRLHPIRGPPALLS